MPDRSSDEFYVGYLPVPDGQCRFLRWCVPALLWALCMVMFLWARSQHARAVGTWDQGRPVELSGTVVARPYPMLITNNPGSPSEAVLLVESGKFGTQHRSGLHEGQAVTVSGWLLHRDGRRMLEMEPGETIKPTVGTSPPARTALDPVGRVTLRGEIVDSKCFLGAMKPGEGKTHKECATLCIRGGIPPMLVTYDASGAASFTLLAGPDGGAIESGVLPFVGDSVEVAGDLFELAGLRILRLAVANIRRL